jgi:DNA-binding transcriptional LysR family regulator
MKYQSPLPPLDDMGLFVAVVRAGGFTAAARTLGLRKAFVSKRLRALEERLGVSLLHRTTRAVRLSEEGQVYFAHAERAVDAAREGEAVLSATRAAPSGVLRVTTTSALAEVLLEPVVLAYLEKHPRVRVELDDSARSLDLIREGWDVAVRAGALPDSSLRATKLGTARGGFWASPDYLEARGVPDVPSALHRHVAVAMHGSPPEWGFEQAGRRVSVVVPTRLVTTSYALAVRAARAGVGIVRAPDFYVREDVVSGRLRAVLPEWTPRAAPVHAVTPPGVWPPKTRVFVAMLGRFLRKRSVLAA